MDGIFVTGLRMQATLNISGCWPMRWLARNPPWLPPTTDTLLISSRGVAYRAHYVCMYEHIKLAVVIIVL